LDLLDLQVAVVHLLFCYAINGCAYAGRQDYFGVRSYLHQFYEPGASKSTTTSKHCKYKYNWGTSSPHGQCSGIYWWKTMATFGAGYNQRIMHIQ